MIIPYDEKYRDDMIFMVLEAKDVLGRVPRLNEDLLDVQKNYFDTGDMFWLAIDEHDRVQGKYLKARDVAALREYAKRVIFR